MQPAKQYTVASHPDDSIIRMAISKKLTNIVFTKNPNNHKYAGWVLECDQVPFYHFYGNKLSILETMRRWRWVGGVFKT